MSASWAVPSDAVSGVYLAAARNDTERRDSHIPFVVRNDASTSDVLFQTSDATWQAYNTYGGADFYQGNDARPGLQDQLQPSVLHARRRAAAATICSATSTR